MDKARKRNCTLVFAVVCAVLLTTGHASFAADSADCRILTILANVKEKPQVDQELGPYNHILAQKPFDRFNSFELVKKQRLELTLGAASKLQLPQKLSGQLNLNKRTGSMLLLSLSLSKGGSKPANIDFKATPGAPFFTAGFKNDKGTWIIGVICNGQS